MLPKILDTARNTYGRRKTTEAAPDHFKKQEEREAELKRQAEGASVWVTKRSTIVRKDWTFHFAEEGAASIKQARCHG